MENQENAGAEDQQQEQGGGSEKGTQDGDQGHGSQEREEGKDYFEPFKDQQRRAVKAEGEARGYKQQLIDAGVLDKDGKPKSKPAAQAAGQEASSSSQSDELRRVRLEARGVLEEDEQDVVMRAAKVLGITDIEALKDETVQAQLKRIRDKKSTDGATPAPTRGGGTTTNIGRLADKALETGELPTDPKLKAQVKEELKRRSQRS